MKTILLTIALASATVSLLAQGTIVFVNTGGAGATAFKFPIYGPEAGGGPMIKTGNTSAGAPPGTQVYTGALLTGSGYSAQLFAAPGANIGESYLVAAFPISPFRTGTAAGFVPISTATLSNVLPDAQVATVQLRVWDNHGGLYATWASALVAWQSGLTAAGMSAPINVSAIGGNLNAPPTLLGMQSFNLVVPEPATWALAGLGLASWLVFCRRN